MNNEIFRDTAKDRVLVLISDILFDFILPFGLVFLFVAIAVFANFGVYDSIKFEIDKIRSDISETTGTFVSCEETDHFKCSITTIRKQQCPDEYKIHNYKVNFKYEIDENEYSSFSYAYNDDYTVDIIDFNEENSFNINYFADNPHKAWIDGSSLTPGGFNWALIIVPIMFTFGGVYMILIGLVIAINRFFLLSKGEETIVEITDFEIKTIHSKKASMDILETNFLGKFYGEENYTNFDQIGDRQENYFSNQFSKNDKNIDEMNSKYIGTKWLVKYKKYKNGKGDGVLVSPGMWKHKFNSHKYSLIFCSISIILYIVAGLVLYFGVL